MGAEYTDFSNQIDAKVKEIEAKEAARKKEIVLAVEPDIGPKGGAATGKFGADDKKERKGSLMDLTSFYSNLQNTISGKKDPVQAGILANGKRVADGIAMLREDLKKATKPGVGMAVGPA